MSHHLRRCRRVLRFEPLERRLLLSGADFGDAPYPYATLLEEAGARHAATGPTLGAFRDADLDGRPDASASGDDAHGEADEDGVSRWVGVRVGALGAQVMVNAQNAPTGAWVDAWIDFDGDGWWGGPFERIACGVAVANGDNAIRFDVPSWAEEGPTYARFRLSTAGTASPAGPADDGEVEDYQVVVAAPVATAGIFGDPTLLADTTELAFSIFPADMDGDGDMDVVSAEWKSGGVVWYENDGNQSFARHTIASCSDAYWYTVVRAVDLDGDADMDVVLLDLNFKLFWLENAGNETFTSHELATYANPGQGVLVRDMDD